MGLRGPAPKPTALRKLEGNPSKRPLPLNEPQYPPGVPTKPKKISKRASPIWDELVDQMAPAAILRRVDRMALWQLCEDEAILANAYEGIWSMANAIKREAKAQGKRLDQGEIMALLSMKNGRMAMSAVGHLAARVIIERREFGLTPSSRSRIDAAADGGAMDALEMKLCG
jgi:P27 family predicted phage terminase small subunit